MSQAVERMLLDTAAFQSACSFGECVEVAMTEAVAVSDSKAGQDGPVMWFTRDE